MEIYIKACGVLVAFIALVYTSINSKRNAEKHQVEMLKLELEILDKLSSSESNAYYQKAINSASIRADNVYRDFKPYYPVYFRVGLIVYIGFALNGFVLMYSEYSVWWVIASYSLSLIGFEMQRRGLTPNMSGKPAKLKLKS
ncbi:hypothetical protein [Shewanella sp. 10N.286.48.A6]|uniref:hypothetical protein n=1 Tax=Shewanella sp. 10N.286.48.A6 TaxID=1880833 RepID=UPI000C861E65|nr:hypothetical protein [Shewanella sp. 10N.286.48.A6]PMH94732.1 hypothetical protein BCU55_03645 [Shewanella sp. 10N.286.48.A6]